MGRLGEPLLLLAAAGDWNFWALGGAVELFTYAIPRAPEFRSGMGLSMSACCCIGERALTAAGLWW